MSVLFGRRGEAATRSQRIAYEGDLLRVVDSARGTTVYTHSTMRIA